MNNAMPQSKITQIAQLAKPAAPAKITLSNGDFIPFARFSDKEKQNIKKLRAARLAINKYRFIEIDGHLYIHENYTQPFFHKLADLYYRARESTPHLNKKIAKLSGKPRKTIEGYFHRFTFKKAAAAQEYISILEQIIYGK
ncbi:MAG: hypothetical protein ACTTIC_05925 [Helicobacteraceae bacterium]